MSLLPASNLFLGTSCAYHLRKFGLTPGLTSELLGPLVAASQPFTVTANISGSNRYLSQMEDFHLLLAPRADASSNAPSYGLIHGARDGRHLERLGNAAKRVSADGPSACRVVVSEHQPSLFEQVLCAFLGRTDQAFGAS